MDEIFDLLWKLNDATAEERKVLYGMDEQEAAVVLDQPTVPHMLATLAELRGTLKPKSFRQRLTKADALHARALGIQL